MAAVIADLGPSHGPDLRSNRANGEFVKKMSPLATRSPHNCHRPGHHHCRQVDSEMYNRVVGHETDRRIGWDPANAEQTGSGWAGASYSVVGRSRRASALR